jgi:FixJ family two-component response regulator
VYSAFVPATTQQNKENHAAKGSSPSEVVCLVDDDPSVRKAVSRLLESAGFNVKAFGDPALFLDYLGNNYVPVVVLDIWMERMTGMELLERLYTTSPRTRVIFITGHEDQTAEAKVMQAGAFGFLIKPFDDEPFLSMVVRALAGKDRLGDHPK